jgi:Ser/Thr protein kinase RdoA (MazF antagonist)
MTDPLTGPLTGAQRAAVEAVLAGAWGEPVAVVSATGLAERDHVVRVETAGGRTAVVKRPRPPGDGPWPVDPEGLAVEWAALDHLTAVAPGVAPRLLGGDDAAGLVVMEDLPPGRSLDVSLLGDDPVAARDDVVALSRALAALHAGTLGTAEGFAAARVRRGLPAVRDPWWPNRLAAATPAFTEEAAGLGVAGADLAGDLDRMAAVLTGRFVGLVHGDPCPDNVLIFPGGCRVLDFERASMASVALDAAYLLAPFPSCWCFGRLPADVVAAGLSAYEEALDEAGVARGDAWTEAVAAALALFTVVRVGDWRGPAVDAPTVWGTTTARPRLAAWTAALLAAPGAAAFPHVVAAVARWRERHGLDATAVPGYPALG